MNDLHEHDELMARCLALAGESVGLCEPNPPVGALLVVDGRVIGRGRTQRCGGAHAEVMAIEDARKAGYETAGAAMYVTLEPCSHYGRTPPCADAVIAAGISRVVVGIEDPYPQVSGRGIAMLRSAGVDVTVGVRAAEVRRLLGPYLKRVRTGRPWVVCKWAQTLDGRLATRTASSRWISSEASRARVHELRSICDGIAVGVGTVEADDPLLTCRAAATAERAHRTLTRVVLDGRLKTPPESQLLKTVGQGPVVIVCSRRAAEASPGRAEALRVAGAELLAVDADANGRLDLAAMLDEFGRRDWTRLLIEGGPTVLGSVLSGGLADELQVYIAPKLLGDPAAMGLRLPQIIETMDQAVKLPAPEIETIGGDVLLRYLLSDYSGK